jgi:primosomal protein N' (replication factor Y)
MVQSPSPAAGVAGASGRLGRLVEVAIDAAGPAGAQAYTYHVPDHLGDLVPGEAVVVGFGSRQVLGVVLGEAAVRPAIETRPIVARVRADGPLLPPLALAFARWIAATYLAPPAVVLRSMLAPGLLERFELVAELRPGSHAAVAAGDAAIVEALSKGPRRVRELGSSEGRAGLLRRLRSMETAGLVDLDWVLEAAGPGPRYERWVLPAAEGSEAVGGSNRPLGPRQRAALHDLRAAGASGLTAPVLASRHGDGAVAGLVRRGLAAIEVRERPRRPHDRRAAGTRGARPRSSTLTAAQADAVTRIGRAIADRDPMPTLLAGVTGGGKTAVYAEAIRTSLDGGRPVLVLVPEIALALPLVDRLRAELDPTVALVHSALSDGERTDEWRRIRAGDVEVVVGTRLAIGSPLGDVGLIIVDEEHDPAYKSDRTPRLQARDGAMELGRLAGAAIVLGSATPAVETVGRASAGAYRRIDLPDRPTGQEPTIEVVDLRAELAAGNRGLLSRRLVDGLETLDPGAGDQAILMINRRGTASAVLCRDCGTIQACPECERPLVYHQAGMTLRCHHCGRATPLATRCPACRSPRIRYLGGGTERVEREVRERLPNLRIGRLDRDVVERRGAAQRVLDDFHDHRVDVLVGTSLVAKGIDVPGVVLVGIVSADVALNLPDERAAERTFQLLRQAIGRAGRGEQPGQAIIQTYQPDHPVIVAVRDHDPAAFYAGELELRRRFGSPPFGRLVKLTVALPDRAAAEAEGKRLADELRHRVVERRAAVTVAGPAPAYIARRADRWRWNVVLRGDDPVALLDGGLPAPWSVDVDPESLL